MVKSPDRRRVIDHDSPGGEPHTPLKTTQITRRDGQLVRVEREGLDAEQVTPLPEKPKKQDTPVASDGGGRVPPEEL